MHTLNINYHSDPCHLLPGQWSPAIYKLLNGWLMHIRETPGTDAVVAVFDFDNTCIYRDVGKAVFRFQLSSLHFRISPTQLATLFPESMEHIGGKSFSVVKNRILSLYETLWPFLEKGQNRQALQHEGYEEFAGLLFWYYSKISKQQSLGPEYPLTFLAKLLAGYSTNELEDLTCHAIVAALHEPITTDIKTVQCCETIGVIKVYHATGLKVHHEIADLMDSLQSVGIRCCIVSASTEWIIKAATVFCGFPVQEEDIYGIRLELDETETLTTKLTENYPVTYRNGKVKIINEYIGATPVLVAGDAITDFEMLTIPLTPIRLVINHNKTDLISALYNDPRFLLQGIDKKTGSFRPHQETLERTGKKYGHLRANNLSERILDNVA
jgi:phosphoserine phosphatase